MTRLSSLALLLTLGIAFASFAQQPKLTRDQQVIADKKKIEKDGFWIYNDFAKGLAEAKKTGKPLAVVLRCVPCVECVKLDDDLVNTDPRVRPLLDKFVCVRIISTNGLDMSIFQFDYDQSFATFFLNADGTIYGRFGTRSHRTTWADDVAIEGLAKALQGALDLHAGYPKNKEMLAAKKGPAPEVASPEKFELMKGKYAEKINFEGNVGMSCIHCHQVGDAQRVFYRSQQKPIPEKILFSYPHPKSLGLILDPKEKATVLRIDPGTPAEKWGLQKGDEILTLAGQPLLSMADVQWVLHNTPGEGASLAAHVKRGNGFADITFKLEKGWRQRDDYGWRVTSWPQRRMAIGGLSLETMTAEARAQEKLPAEGMALRIKAVGNFGAHAAAKNAGFQMGDVIISYDGKIDFARECDLLAYGVNAHKPGEKVAVVVLRKGAKVELMMPIQE